MCGAMNPVGNAYCDQCNARIVPMTASPSEGPERDQPPIKGLSLPTIPLEGEEQPVGGMPQEPEARAEDEMAEDWLTQLRASAEEKGDREELTEEIEAEGEGEEAGEEAEDWLAQLRTSTAEKVEGPEPEFATEPIEPVEIPDWLRELGPVGGEAEAAPPEAPPPAAEAALAPAEIPDWLQEIAPAEPAPSEAKEETLPETPSPAAEAALAPAEIPDWLQEITPAEPALSETAAAPEAPPPAAEAAVAAETATEKAIPAMPTPVPAEIPDWLQEIAPAGAPEAAPPAAEAAVAGEAAIEETAPAIPAPTPTEIPDWLQEAAPAEVAPPPAPFADVTPPSAAEAPEWLRDIAAEEEVTPEALPPVPPLVEFPAEGETTEVPEWLTELKEEGAAQPSAPTSIFAADITPPFVTEPGAELAEAEGLARAEIPEWLKAMRPRAEAAEAVVEEEPLETGGLLEGLRGVLTPAPVAETLHTIEAAVPPAVSEASLARAQLLQSLLARPAKAPQVEARRPGISTTERIQRWIVAVMLLIPLLMLMWQQIGEQVGFPEPPILTQADASRAEPLYKAIEGLSAGDTVLVAFEYGPAEADELNLVARPILQHLLDREAHVLPVSTRPEGAALSVRLLSDIAPEKEYEPTYRPGGAAGAAQLLADADTNLALVLVLAAQPAPLRWWVEQAHTRGESAPPVVAGVSAALEAVASPYLDPNAGQLQGVISGLSEAAAYEDQHPGSEDHATQQLNALAAGHIAVIALMVVGAVLHGFTALRRKGE
jgi:hypothetical protein